MGMAPAGLFLTTVFAFLLGVVMLIPQQRERVPGSSAALGAAVLGAVAELVVFGTLSAWWPKTPGVFASNVGLCGTALLFWAALGLVLDRPVPRRWLVAVGAGVAVIAAALLLSDSSWDVRIIVNSAGSALIFAGIARTAPVTGRSLPYGARLVGLVAWLAVVVRLARAAVYAIHLASVGRMGDPTTANTVSTWLVSLIVPILLVGLSLIGQQRMVTDQARLAATDYLTGTLSRRAWMSAVADLRAARGDVTLLFIDLDHFKVINDRIGHAGGDRALGHVASVLAPLLAPGEVLGRFGGEEFVVAVPGDAMVRTQQLGEQALRNLATQPLVHDGVPVPISFSAGASVLREYEPLEVALQRADAAMYEAKSTGRGRLVLAPER